MKRHNGPNNFMIPNSAVPNFFTSYMKFRDKILKVDVTRKVK